jgi:CubicO group peptidase (beta-lactamase class C family)
MQLDQNTLALINKACKGKKHIKLTIGFSINGVKTIKVFDENRETENENYVYEIASITKTFTASLLAKYIHENKMSLDDSIKKYFNGLGDNIYYPTLRRLATHTAGYSMNLPFTWRDFLLTPLKGYPTLPNVENIKIVLQKNKRQDKDYPWLYSNYGFILLGHAIGIVSGTGYWNAMDDFLSNELDLPNTYTGTCPEKNLHGFNNRNMDCGNYLFDKSPTVPSGEGDISSTAEDLLKYAQININEEKPYLSLCHRKHSNVSSLFAAILRGAAGVKEFDMGLGWMFYKENNNILMHPGDSDSFSSFLALDKSKKLASVVLSNYKMDTTKIVLSLLK